MSVAVTLVSSSGEHDLLLPRSTALAVLEPHLEDVAGVDGLHIADAAGRPLDRDLSLAANGVCDGALLQALPPAAEITVLDDAADLLRKEAGEYTAPPAALIVATALAALLGGRSLGAQAPFLSAGLVVGYTVLNGLLARAVLAISGLGPLDDPHSAGVLRRSARALHASACLTAAAAALGLGGALALCASANPWLVAAGWCTINLLIVRAGTARWTALVALPTVGAAAWEALSGWLALPGWFDVTGAADAAAGAAAASANAAAGGVGAACVAGICGALATSLTLARWGRHPGHHPWCAALGRPLALAVPALAAMGIAATLELL